MPKFDGSAGTVKDYLRRVAVWEDLCSVPADKQALQLYFHFEGKVWRDAEVLDQWRLARPGGVGFLVQWVQRKYGEVEVLDVGQALEEFFVKLARKPGQSVREFNNEFERQWSLLAARGVQLPETAAAWFYLQKLQYGADRIAGLLASCGNRYHLESLLKAAVVQGTKVREEQRERSHKTHFLEDLEPDGDDSNEETEDEEVMEAMVAFRGAKAKYQEFKKSRGYANKNKGSHEQKDREKRLAEIKAKSVCSGASRRGTGTTTTSAPRKGRETLHPHGCTWRASLRTRHTGLGSMSTRRGMASWTRAARGRSLV